LQDKLKDVSEKLKGHEDIEFKELKEMYDKLSPDERKVLIEYILISRPIIHRSKSRFQIFS